MKRIRDMLKNKAVAISVAVLGALFFLLLLGVVIINLVVWGRAKSRIVDLNSSVLSDEKFDCIIVLGAGVWADNTPSPMLADRLDYGLELYFSGASDRLLMSGDHMTPEYDEVGVMKTYAMEAGVPSDHIFLDHAGLSTYESMWRAKEIYGAERVLVVTQEYHLYRAVYVAQELGMEAYGVASDPRAYRNWLSRELREVLARAKDFFFVMAKPDPTYIGASFDLSGDGDSTNVNPFFPEPDKSV